MSFFIRLTHLNNFKKFSRITSCCSTVICYDNCQLVKVGIIFVMDYKFTNFCADRRIFRNFVSV